MLDFYLTVQNFFVRDAYVFEVLMSVGLFCYFYERKNLFWLRFLLCFGVMMSFSVLWNFWKDAYVSLTWGLVFYDILKYVVFFLLGFAATCFCMRTSMYHALFSSIGAMATQHFSYRVFAIILTLCGFTFDSLYAFLIDLAVIVTVYGSVHFIFIRKVKKQEEYCFENKSNIYLSGLLIFFTIVLHFLTEPFVNMNNQPVIFIFLSVYDLLCCVFTFMVEYGTFSNTKLINENSILEQLMRKQEEQYRMTKDNIEMINIKCHDMKHQLSRLTKGKDADTIDELENIIKIYDTSLKTGNEVLDVFLADKKLQCERNDIKFECIVNGECLSFMTASDIFSLFGNALDNSIEALKKIEEKEKRVIGMTVKTSLDMVVIHIENYFNGEIIYKNGLPQTMKGDENYHGFGLRSIRLVAEKYDGDMSILVDKDIFNLNIVIPNRVEEP